MSMTRMRMGGLSKWSLLANQKVCPSISYNKMKFSTAIEIVGVAIGSVQIDQAFQDIVEERLKIISRQDPNLTFPRGTMDHIVKNLFQTAKLKLGSEGETPVYRFEITGLSGLTFPECMIENGRMVFTR